MGDWVDLRPGLDSPSQLHSVKGSSPGLLGLTLLVVGSFWRTNKSPGRNPIPKYYSTRA